LRSSWSCSLLFSYLNAPVLKRDEGVFVYIGQQVLGGKIPYRDVWDHKGPLIYYINALGLWIGGGSLWGIWLVEAILLATSLILLYLLVRRNLGTAAAVFGLLTWVTGFTIVMGGNIVEEYSILPAVLSLYLVMNRPRHSGLLVGLLAGLAFTLRPNEVAAPAVALLLTLSAELKLADWSAVLREPAGVLTRLAAVLGRAAFLPGTVPGRSCKRRVRVQPSLCRIRHGSGAASLQALPISVSRLRLG
jgi:hypothetical protein